MEGVRFIDGGSEVKVKDIMHGITVVDRNTSVFDAARLMSDKEIGSVLAKEGDCIKIVTERDILKKIVALGCDPKDTTVSEIMNECSYTIDAEMDVFDASDLFNKYHIRRLPVMLDGKVVGIITTRDVARSVVYLAARNLLGIGKGYYGKPSPSGVL